jgi:hypothetical protein
MWHQETKGHGEESERASFFPTGCFNAAQGQDADPDKRRISAQKKILTE